MPPLIVRVGISDQPGDTRHCMYLSQGSQQAEEPEQDQTAAVSGSTTDGVEISPKMSTATGAATGTATSTATAQPQAQPRAQPRTLSQVQLQRHCSMHSLRHVAMAQQAWRQSRLRWWQTFGRRAFFDNSHTVSMADVFLKNEIKFIIFNSKKTPAAETA